MNHIGTHDTIRIITRLASKNININDREVQSKLSLNSEEYTKGVQLVKLAAIIQYTLPGVPSLYYGDEIGLEGFGDPFCRSSFDWSKTNSNLTKFYMKLGKIRRNTPAFVDGEFIPIILENGLLVFERKNNYSQTLTVINNSDNEITFSLPDKYYGFKTNFNSKLKDNKLTISAYSADIITV